MSSLIIDRDYLRSIIKDVIRKRRDQEDKKDQIFLDSLMDADFIDEEEVCFIMILHFQNKLYFINFILY